MKIKLYYYWQQYNHQSYEEGKVVVYTESREGPLWEELTFIDEIDIDIPNRAAPTKHEVMNKLVVRLRAEKQKLQAETEVKLQKIEDKIRQLSALEYKPEQPRDYEELP